MKTDSTSAGQRGFDNPELGKPSDDIKRIARALRQLMQYLDTHSRQLLKNHDVKMPQIMCLDVLRERGATTVAILAEAIHLSPSTTVGIIDRLEKKKLAKRTRGSVDRRSVFVDITEAGREFVLAAPNLLHNRLEDSLRAISRNEQAQVANSFDLLVRLLRENRL